MRYVATASLHGPVYVNVSKVDGIVVSLGNMLMCSDVLLTGTDGETDMLQEARIGDDSFVRAYVGDRKKVAAVERNMRWMCSSSGKARDPHQK